MLTFAACKDNSGDDTSGNSTSESGSISEIEEPSESESVSQSESDSRTESQPISSETEPSETASAPAEVQKTDYSSYSKADIVNFLSAAVNKTKGYTGNITVHHKESFSSTITNVNPGGNLVTQAVNFVKDLVIKPSEEDYFFADGIALASEGEKIQLLLPKTSAFSLTPNGVESASISDENGLAHVVLTLVPEEVNSLSDIPKFNASSIGYLDIAGEFSVISVQEVNIKYSGSIIDALIRSDGYVQSVTYSIPLSAYAKAVAMGITGSADFTGEQIEVWDINW